MEDLLAVLRHADGKVERDERARTGERPVVTFRLRRIGDDDVGSRVYVFIVATPEIFVRRRLEGKP